MMSKVIILVLSAFFIAVIYAHPAPTTCDQNEVYLQQGEAPDCETVCSELGDTCYVNYIWPPFGCYCEDGYARDDNYDCIPISDCPPKVSTTPSPSSSSMEFE
ncbi:inducible metalloproteinase inhibitor protein-like [Eupeodes corollae]|uniref:inducible metalloproteinase inhibitor protein-like n=1 Tax=Eupeodes corollae TaxID=290404 RepID=UPI002491A127|nr:inducible metalloproteinase inhibitor protein-like [Eupeodes corollae]